ncbi:MAG: HAMP domain-containing histidine kinase [Elusimicrobia bacterium]|nr:HAMP domain-containing histidine kinase [Elusimicrobiota bacterium]
MTMIAAAVFVAGAALGAFIAYAACSSAARRRERTAGRLLSFANHELNTPATAVNMTVINLLSGVFGEVPPDQKRWLEMTRDQVGRLNALVGELRDLVHLELLRDLRPMLGEAEPAELVEDACASLRGGFEQAGVELKTSVGEALPVVRTDADRLARSLASLLFHARKFRLSGPVSLRVAADGPAVLFEVSYTGAALSPEEAAASLDLWYPARERKDQKLAATGLGLGLTRAVARACGGDLLFAVDEKGRSRLTLSAPANGG